MTVFIGIDPGLHGAIAAIAVVSDVKFGDAISPASLYVADMPTHEITVNGKKRTQIDKHRLRDILTGIGPGCRAFVEDVHSMPKQGVASSFKFGFVAGAIQQAVVDAGFELTLVPPQVWKRRFGLTSDKDAARARASAVFPGSAHLWSRKKDDGRAEAALLALYGARYG